VFLNPFLTGSFQVDERIYYDVLEAEPSTCIYVVGLIPSVDLLFGRFRYVKGKCLARGTVSTQALQGGQSSHGKGSALPQILRNLKESFSLGFYGG
jgi:hypothetical protein